MQKTPGCCTKDRGRAASLALAVAVGVLWAGPARAQPTTLDDFETVGAWAPVAADGVGVRLSQGEGVAGHALRMDFDFRGGAGYAIARRPLALTLPADYRLRLWLRAESADGGPAPANDLEIKLVGVSGDDVWWHNRRRFDFPAEWAPLTTRARHVEFAWGPLGGGPPGQIGAVEIAVTAQEGGAGTVWIDSLTVEPVTPGPTSGTPTATASAASGAAGRALDGDPATDWRAPPGPQTWTLDAGRVRELGGLTLDWGGAWAADYDVEASEDGARWTTRWAARGSDGGRDYVPLPDTDARYVRLRLARAATAAGYALAQVAVEPLAFAATPSALFERVAADAPRGHYPRYLVGEAAFWTVVGADGDEAEALVGEGGAVEVGKGAFSVEPFLVRGGRLLTWADADSTVHSLAQNALPIPTATRHHGPLALATTAWVAGRDSSATLAVRYRVTNAGAAADTVTLALVVRPFLVNPSYQFLSAPSGVARVERVRQRGATLVVDGRALTLDREPDGALGAGFAGGGVVQALAGAARAEGTRGAGVDDPAGRAEAAVLYRLAVPAGGAREVTLRAPMLPGAPGGATAGLAETEAAWAGRLGGFAVSGPDEAEALADVVRAQVGYVLVNRDGPAVQPGSRAYDRSWIRDGALTSAALLRVGLPGVATDFARWYAPFQYPSGKVPCCVDDRGADPVPEHDSHGELVYLVAETFRHTGDRAFLAEMWPHVRAAAAFMDSLRATTQTAAYRSDSLRHLYGLMPPSISHEGYSAKPAYSYWDDLWALRGYRDAVFVAQALGHADDARALAASRDAFAADLAASVRRALAVHGLDVIPGAADLGDVDPTSTSIALDPVGARDVLPADALDESFERYWRFFQDRMSGAEPWEAYTPYEWRNVGAMLRLGHPERAHAAARWLLGHRRPAGWQHWAEVVWDDARAPRFIGDMPHTWVGSDALRAILDLFAYEEPDGGPLAVGAGVPMRWAEGGLSVSGIETAGGPVAYRVSREGDAVTVAFDALPDAPAVVHAPFGAAPRRATADGRPVPLAAGAVALDRAVRRVTFFY